MICFFERREVIKHDHTIILSLKYEKFGLNWFVNDVFFFSKDVNVECRCKIEIANNLLTKIKIENNLIYWQNVMSFFFPFSCFQQYIDPLKSNKRKLPTVDVIRTSFS